METLDDGITEFIHERTGFPRDLISRVVEIGDPWPFVASYGRFMKTSNNDAKSLALPLWAALVANAGLLGTGVDGMDPDSLDRHKEQVTTLSGVELAKVETISDALTEYFESRLDRVQRVIDEQTNT